jgi:hypothetical protein
LARPIFFLPFSFSSTRRSPAGLSPFLPLPPAWPGPACPALPPSPQPNGPPVPNSLLPFLSLTARWSPLVGLVFKLDSDLRLSPAVAQPPLARRPGPHAKPPRQPYEAVPLIPENPRLPLLALQTLAMPPPPPLHLGCPLLRRSTSYHHRTSDPEALHCGKKHRRPLFPFFPAFPHARYLTIATVPCAAAVHVTPDL